MPLPDKIANAPSLDAGLDLYYTAFMDLTTCRQWYGEGLGPISWLAINAYCIHHGIIDDQRYDLEYHVGQLDSTYLSIMRRRSSAK